MSDIMDMSDIPSQSKLDNQSSVYFSTTTLLNAFYLKWSQELLSVSDSSSLMGFAEELWEINEDITTLLKKRIFLLKTESETSLFRITCPECQVTLVHYCLSILSS